LRKMFQIVFLVLKIIGLILLIFLGMLLLMLFGSLLIPVRYRVFVGLEGKISVDGSVSWLLHMMHLQISSHGKKIRIRLKILGIRVYDNLRRKDRKKSSTVKQDRENDTVTEKQSRKSRQRKDKTVHDKNADRNDKIKNATPENNKKIKSISQKWMGKTKGWKEKGNLAVQFLKDEINRQGFGAIGLSLRRMMRHMAPKKLKGKIVFGTGDPCTTGQTLGVLGVLYSIYGDRIEIIPDFEEKRLEGSLMAGGRIRLITVLIIVIKLILDRRFKQLRSNWKTVKEAL
jgi:hypothetical protein